MTNLSLHAVNKWLSRRIPINQELLAFIRRSSKEFGEEPKEFNFKDLTIVGALDETGEPTVVTVYKNAKIMRRKKPCNGTGKSRNQYKKSCR